MTRPRKPTKPKLPKEPTPCGCNKGRIKEWDNGPYPDYDWVTCPQCEGRCFLTPHEKLAELMRKYDLDMERYQRQLATWRVLRSVRLSREQIKALMSYGLGTYEKDFL